jgi:non-heme chloroperoxidase
MRVRVPVVMIHGAFCGPWAFEKFRLPFERKGYTVHAPVLRYHDRGQEPPAALGTTSLTDFAADLSEFIKTLEAPPILLGHSMGGLLAQMLAARLPVRAIVLLAPCPPWGVLPSTVFEIASAQAMFLAGDFWNQVLRPAYWIAKQNSLDRLSSAERHAVFDRFVPESGLATFEIMQGMFDARRAADVRARDVTCPIFALAGAEDRINSPATVRRIAQRYRGRARYDELEGHSHWLLGEPGWEKIAARVIEWLDEVLKEDAKAKAR